MDVIPIVNENDTISPAEIKFGDNDTLSAITAGMVNADYLFLLTDVDCLYTDNPRANPDAKAVRVVDDITKLRASINVTAPGSSLGTGGMVTKLIAADLATTAGVTTFIARGSAPSNVIRIVDEVYVHNSRVVTPVASPARTPVAGHPPPTTHEQNITVTSSPPPVRPRKVQVANIGQSPDLLYTCFLAEVHPLRDRKWWVKHGIHTAGTITVDRGAVRALLHHKGSLFSAGITGVEGAFVAHQGVRLVYAYVDADGQPAQLEVARGLVNYASTEIHRIKGRHSWEIADLLGYACSECVINRDNLTRTLLLEEWQQWDKSHPSNKQATASKQA